MSVDRQRKCFAGSSGFFSRIGCKFVTRNFEAMAPKLGLLNPQKYMAKYLKEIEDKYDMTSAGGG